MSKKSENSMKATTFIGLLTDVNGMSISQAYRCLHEIRAHEKKPENVRALSIGMAALDVFRGMMADSYKENK